MARKPIDSGYGLIVIERMVEPISPTVQEYGPACPGCQKRGMERVEGTSTYLCHKCNVTHALPELVRRMMGVE